jgi:hypothetical protein
MFVINVVIADFAAPHISKCTTNFPTHCTIGEGQRAKTVKTGRMATR